MKIIRPQNPEKVDDIGDILVEDPLDDSFFLPVSQGLFDQYKLLRLPERRPHPWKVLERLGVENAQEIDDACRYNCPWTDNAYWMFIPAYILYKDQGVWDLDNNKSVWPFGRDFAFAEDWHRDSFKSNQSMEQTEPNAQFEFIVPIDSVVRSFLGHGYTICTLPDDGSGELKGAALQLSNGDLVMGKVWVWYNK